MVGLETGDIDGDGVGVAVGDGVGEGGTLSLLGEGVGVDVSVGVGDADAVGAGVMLAVASEDVGDGCATGEICFWGDCVLLGVADVAAREGVGVGDLPAPDGEDFDFGAGVGVGFGVGVCALRSTPRCAPRVAALPVLAGGAERFTLKGGKNDFFFGVGVGVGVGAALSDNTRPSTNSDISKKILRLIIQLHWSNS